MTSTSNQQVSADKRELPELPKMVLIDGRDWQVYGYSADQMRAYAQAALAHSRAQDSGGEAVTHKLQQLYDAIEDVPAHTCAMRDGRAYNVKENLTLIHEQLAELLGATPPPKVKAQRGVSIAYNALRSIRYNAENGSQDRPLHHRLHLISTEANKAIAALEADLAHPPQTAKADGCTEANCPRCMTHPDHRGDMHHAGIGSRPQEPTAA